MNTKKTNVLIIKFDARLKEGLIKRDAEYKPYMSSPNVYRMYNSIYFTPYVLIDNKDLDAAIGSKLNREDKQLVFLKSQQFNSYVKYMASRDDLPEKSMEQLEEPGGIIERNIKFILELFFGNKALFYLGDKEYTVQGYEWNRDFRLSNKGESPNVEINLRFLLSEGKDSSFMKSVEVSCAQKWDSIKADYAFLTGFKENINLSKKENEEAKKKWKEEYAAQERDAPYTKQPTATKGPNLLRKKNIRTPLSYNEQQLQSARERSRSQMALAKLQAEEAKKARIAAAEESKIRREEAEKSRLAAAEEAEKARAAAAEEAEKSRVAEKERLTMEAKTAEKLRKLEDKRRREEKREEEERRLAYNEARNMKRREEREKERAFAEAVNKGLVIPRRTGRKRITKKETLKESELTRNSSFGESKKRTRKKK